MIGDGVNDAPAAGPAQPRRRDGRRGSDAAIETADVALMADDLSNLPWLIRHSRRTLARHPPEHRASRSRSRRSSWSSTFAGFASLWAAIAADMGASLLVVFNALRLLRSAKAGSGSSP